VSKTLNIGQPIYLIEVRDVAPEWQGIVSRHEVTFDSQLACLLFLKGSSMDIPQEIFDKFYKEMEANVFDNFGNPKFWAKKILEQTVEDIYQYNSRTDMREDYYG
jgi:hypothetical protein